MRQYHQSKLGIKARPEGSEPVCAMPRRKPLHLRPMSDDEIIARIEKATTDQALRRWAAAVVRFDLNHAKRAKLAEYSQGVFTTGQGGEWGGANTERDPCELCRVLRVALCYQVDNVGTGKIRCKRERK